MVQKLIEKDYYLCKIYLKDAYLTISVNQNDQKFLRFLWKRNLFQFQTLPFDILILAKTNVQLVKSRNTTLSLLKPVQNISFLEFEENSANMLFKLPEKRCKK